MIHGSAGARLHFLGPGGTKGYMATVSIAANPTCTMRIKEDTGSIRPGAGRRDLWGPPLPIWPNPKGPLCVCHSVFDRSANGSLRASIPRLIITFRERNMAGISGVAYCVAV
ncbi:isoleucyl-tRNA synthetase [Anopheles sinensis]|uniref:Isoleucyl-tRNA synthetase n=1 Tax=Anopheles sinensis TaxID=74873 RepID=A0A084V9T7_ANOSI|nr:isoleucyl-tRNA synthetase [Anopheles sinensis]